MRFDFTGITYGELVLLQSNSLVIIYSILNEYCDVDLFTQTVNNEEFEKAIAVAVEEFTKPIPDIPEVFKELDI